MELGGFWDTGAMRMTHFNTVFAGLGPAVGGRAEEMRYGDPEPFPAFMPRAQISFAIEGLYSSLMPFLCPCGRVSCHNKGL